MIELDENGEATIVWVGTHQEYETTFKNNKNTIEKWLRNNGYLNNNRRLLGVNRSDFFHPNDKQKTSVVNLKRQPNKKL